MLFYQSIEIEKKLEYLVTFVILFTRTLIIVPDLNQNVANFGLLYLSSCITCLNSSALVLTDFKRYPPQLFLSNSFNLMMSVHDRIAVTFQYSTKLTNLLLFWDVFSKVSRVSKCPLSITTLWSPSSSMEKSIL